MANEEHAEWAVKAINAGKHVLIEKPMATNLADIEAIEKAAIKNNVKVMEGFMYRFHPQHARVAEIVKSGVIGDILSVRSSFSFLMREARMYRINRAMSQGGGAMWDIGPYAIHTLRWCFFGIEPKSVIAHAKLNEYGADIVTSGVLDFGNDAKNRARFGHFDVSFDRSRKSEYEVIGDKGWLKCHTVWAFDKDIPVISWGTDAGDSGEEKLAPANHFVLEIDHFSDCVLNNKTPLLSFSDAKVNCETIQAVLQSVATSSKVALD
jgi:D-xylose 1-dehydrogenase (NADP+, D-xylono-1,5-lactone-forming)